MEDQKDRSADVAKGSGATAAGAYVGQRRRRVQPGRKRPDRPLAPEAIVLSPGSAALSPKAVAVLT
jgi:hypothetical protein